MAPLSNLHPPKLGVDSAEARVHDEDVDVASGEEIVPPEIRIAMPEPDYLPPQLPFRFGGPAPEPSMPEPSTTIDAPPMPEPSLSDPPMPEPSIPEPPPGMPLPVPNRAHSEAGSSYITESGDEEFWDQDEELLQIIEGQLRSEAMSMPTPTHASSQETEQEVEPPLHFPHPPYGPIPSGFGYLGDPWDVDDTDLFTRHSKHTTQPNSQPSTPPSEPVPQTQPSILPLNLPSKFPELDAINLQHEPPSEYATPAIQFDLASDLPPLDTPSGNHPAKPVDPAASTITPPVLTHKPSVTEQHDAGHATSPQSTPVKPQVTAGPSHEIKVDHDSDVASDSIQEVPAKPSISQSPTPVAHNTVVPPPPLPAKPEKPTKPNANSTQSVPPKPSASQSPTPVAHVSTTASPIPEKPSQPLKPAKPTAPTSTPTKPTKIPTDSHPSKPEQSTSQSGEPHNHPEHTRYVNMLLALDDIPQLFNLLASFFTWILLAGFLLFPGTFTNLQQRAAESGDPNNVSDRLLNAVAHVPLFVIAFLCSGVGAAGMCWLSWRWRNNYVWLLSKIFVPGTLNAVAGVLSTLVNIFGAQNGDFSTTAKVTTIVTGTTAVICGGVTLFYQFWLLRRVKAEHDRQVGEQAAGKHGEGVLKRMMRTRASVKAEA